ncbi:hypothetical protein M0804_008895 [Polistes exclamans]|nr:hypothetical protein M0804_008895 [Polistes exclamans]
MHALASLFLPHGRKNPLVGLWEEYESLFHSPPPKEDLSERSPPAQYLNFWRLVAPDQVYPKREFDSEQE